MNKKLGEILIQERVIDENQLEAALAYQKNWGGKLGHAIAELNFAEEIEIAKAISHHIKVPYVNIFSEDFSDEELKKVKESLIRKYEIIPVKKTGNTLEIAMSNPFDLDVICDIQFALGCNVKPLLALESEIAAFIRQYYSGTLVHRKSSKKVFPEKIEVVHQEGIWENTSAHQAQQKIITLILLLVEKGILSSAEAASMMD